MKTTISIILLFIALTSQAQIRPVIIGSHAYFRTAPDDIVFLKHNNQYICYLQCDGSDSSAKYTEITFPGTTYKDSSIVTVDPSKYILTYNYSVLIFMNQELINLFLNQEVLSIKIGNGFKKLNTSQYKKTLIELINYKDK